MPSYPGEWCAGWRTRAMMPSIPWTSKGNRTTDSEMIALAGRDRRVLVSKDDDFVRSFLLKGQPERLLLINTGNIGNRELEALMQAHLP